jgi:hypothetical protein
MIHQSRLGLHQENQCGVGNSPEVSSGHGGKSDAAYDGKVVPPSFHSVHNTSRSSNTSVVDHADGWG